MNLNRLDRAFRHQINNSGETSERGLNDCFSPASHRNHWLNQILRPAAYKDYQKDREIATKALGGIVPLFTNLERQVAVIWLNSNGWLISDLHHRNIMRDREGNPTIIDALIGPVPPTAQRKLAWLRNAVDDAEDLRCGREPRKRMQFGDETDDNSL